MGTVHLVPAAHEWALQAGNQDDGRAGFGNWLRRAREARGLTLGDISQETKIPLRNLEALEHGNLGSVPEFYQRAEVRAIARAVGVDERLAVDRLDSAVGPLAPRKPEARRKPLELNLSPAFVMLAIGALLFTAATMGLASLGSMATPQRDSTADAAAASRPEPVAQEPQPPEAGAPPAVLTVSTPAVVDAPTAPTPTGSTGSLGELVVRTEPSGAHVTVNGIGWGVSPVTIRHLPPGSKHIRVTKAGFVATERVLALDSGRQQSLDLRLTTAP